MDFTSSVVTFLFVSVMVLASIALYFLPTWVAGKRNVEHYWWIVLANLIAGGTGVGWVVVLIWAVYAPPLPSKELSIEYSRPLGNSGPVSEERHG
jgi:hypothetical protein